MNSQWRPLPVQHSFSVDTVASHSAGGVKFALSEKYLSAPEEHVDSG